MKLLSGTKVAHLPELASRILELGRGVADDSLHGETRGRGAHLVGSAFALALIDRGWNLDSRPGREFSVSNCEHSLEPFTLVDSLVLGMLAADAWRRRAAAVGIADVELCPPALDAAPSGR